MSIDTVSFMRQCQVPVDFERRMPFFNYWGEMMARSEGDPLVNGLQRRITHAREHPGNPPEVGWAGQKVDVVHFPESHVAVHSFRQVYPLEQDQRYPLGVEGGKKLAQLTVKAKIAHGVLAER